MCFINHVVQIYSTTVFTTRISMATKVEGAGDCLGPCLWAKGSPAHPSNFLVFPNATVFKLAVQVSQAHPMLTVPVWLFLAQPESLLCPVARSFTKKILMCLSRPDVKSTLCTTFLKTVRGQLELGPKMSPKSCRLSLQMQQSLKLGCFGSDLILRVLITLTD